MNKIFLNALFVFSLFLCNNVYASQISGSILGSGILNDSDLKRSFALLPTPSGVADDNSGFGKAVDIDNGVAVVGAIDANVQGVAIVLEKKGSQWSEVAVLQPPTSPAVFDMDFGTAVAISGEWIVVGIYDEGFVGFSSGAAMLYKYENNSWQFKQLIRASDYDQGGVSGTECFACAVSISADKLVIGAFGEDSPTTQTGAAYVFHLIDGEWLEQQKLQPNNGFANDRFGESVAIDGNQIVVGATGWDQQGNPNGSAFVFNFNGQTWVEGETLNASDGQPNQKFGTSVDIINNTIMVGAVLAQNESAENTGAVYIFNKIAGSWEESQKIVPNGASVGERFGFKIDLEQNRAVIAATQFGSSSDDNVYVYERSEQSWIETKVLSAQENFGGSLNAYGASVALDQDEILIGTNRLFLPNGQTHLAYAYSYEDSDWVENSPIQPAESAACDLFGSRVTYNNNYLAITAPNDGACNDLVATTFGSVYVYYFNGNRWNLEQKIENPVLDDWNSFGNDIQLINDELFISANDQDDNGAVFVYTKENEEWVIAQTLTPSDSSDNNDNFGYSLAVHEDTLMIGSVSNSPVGGFSQKYGAVYVFQKNNGMWQEIQKLRSEDPNDLDNFGFDISIDNDVAMVSVKFSDIGASSNNGSVQIFTRENNLWVVSQELRPNDTESNQRFGDKIIMNGNRAVISSASDSGFGFVYVFEFEQNQWAQTAKLSPSAGAFGFQNSSSIAMLGDTILVGDEKGQSGDSNSGAVYVYSYDGVNWQETDIITQETPTFIGSNFGSDVLLDNQHLIIGANQESVHGTVSGAVYVKSILSDLIFTEGFD